MLVARRAVVLVSGGLDSTTCLAIALDQGYEVTAVTFAYGQTHQVEVDAAKRVLDHYKVEDRVRVDLPLFRALGGSSLVGDGPIPLGDLDSTSIPSTFVGGRNLVFLSCAVAIACARGAEVIMIGVNAVDYSGYPDCRESFIASFQTTAREATENWRLRVRTPLADMPKSEIIKWGAELRVPWHLTHSCYNPTPRGACGECDSCLLRLRGFQEAGYEDPVTYKRNR